jgi:serine/threonine-protein kinase
MPNPKKRPFLTEICSAAIDFPDEWRQQLEENPEFSHDWLLRRLLTFPVSRVLPPHLRIATRLQPPGGDSLVGRVLGNNLLVEWHARGAFGHIYAAETATGERLAVKVFPFFESARHFSRFRQEFEKLQRAAQHPGIIRCYEYGIASINGRRYPWYSMDFALGGDLADRIRTRKERFPGVLPWQEPALRQEVVREFAAIAEATAYLHGQEIVHRDIKPGNVLVMQDGSLKLSDFGLVKDLDPSEATLQRGTLTSLGAVMGTPPYMAPEQEQGREVDQRADVYALGIVLAELATGELPATQAANAEGSTVIVAGPLSQLRKPLVRFIARCTQVQPEGRFANAGEVHEEFRRVQQALGTSPTPAE